MENNTQTPRSFRKTSLFVHNLYLNQKLKNLGTLKRIFRTIARRTLVPVIMLPESIKLTRQFGEIARSQSSRSLLSQFIFQQRLSVRYNIPPESYYMYQFYLHHDVDVCIGYLYDRQIHLLLSFLQKATTTFESRLMEDKLAFFRHCQKHHLYTPLILACFEKNAVDYVGIQKDTPLPEFDLFSKPTEGMCGEGASRWFYKGHDAYENDAKETFTGQELLDHLSQLSLSGDSIILQERIENHTDLQNITSGALCTLRMVTGKRPGGPIEHILSSLRISVGDSPVDNLSQGGIVCPVNEATGKLGNAVSKSLASCINPHKQHPDTGALLEGFQLPFWKEAIDLALKCHASLPNLPFAGWDIAITDKGPIVMEGNFIWGIEVIQIPHNVPLLHTRIGAYYREWMEKITRTKT